MNYKKRKARRNREWRWYYGNSQNKWAGDRRWRQHNASAKEYYFDLYEYICKIDQKVWYNRSITKKEKIL